MGVLPAGGQGGPGEAEGGEAAELMGRDRQAPHTRQSWVTHSFSGQDTARVSTHRQETPTQEVGRVLGRGAGQSREGHFPWCWVWTLVRSADC